MHNKMFKRLFVLAGVLVLIRFIGSQASNPLRACILDPSNGPVYYDAGKYICCGGTLHPRMINSTEYDCCSIRDFDGNETYRTYDKQTHLCCGNQLVPLFDGGYRRSCCKGDDETKFPGEVLEQDFTCCRGRTHKLLGNEDCCGVMKYDTTEYMCCLYPPPSLHKHITSPASEKCCGNQIYDEEAHWCDTYLLPPVIRDLFEDVCTGKPYDVRTHVCCDRNEGPLLKIPHAKNAEHYQCCNKRLINTEEKRCCPASPENRMVEHAIERGDICCGKGSVRDILTEKCCNGVPNKIPITGPLEPHQCCGTKYVKSGNCCNNKEMTPEYLCCADKVEYSQNSNLDCCGDVVYDRKQQVCCWRSSSIKIAIGKNHTHDTDCCMPAEVSYNRHTHNCVQGDVQERPEIRNVEILACPFCRSRAEPSSYCRAKRVYDVTVQRVRFTDKGSVLLVLMRRENGRPERIRIRIPYRCQACIHNNTEYLVFTNRNIKKGNLKLKDKSMFFRKGAYTLEQVKEICDVNMKISQTLKKLTRKRDKSRTTRGKFVRKPNKESKRRPR